MGVTASTDGAVEVYVLDSESRIDEHASENDGTSYSREDEDQNVSPSTRTAAAQGFIRAPTTGQSPVATHGGSFLNDLPMRGAQQPPPQVLHGMGGPHHHGFVEGGMADNGAAPVHAPSTSMGVDMVPSPQDASRRPSIYSDYGGVGGNSMYTQHWQPSTTGSDAQSLYAPQPSMTQAQSFVQPVPVAHQQSYVPNTFVNNLPRQSYDPNHGLVFRPDEVAEVTPASASQHHGYGYLSSDGRAVPALPGVSEVIESVPRGNM